MSVGDATVALLKVAVGLMLQLYPVAYKLELLILKTIGPQLSFANVYNDFGLLLIVNDTENESLHPSEFVAISLTI